jgi:alkylhydroperoxidase family enzyme
MTPRIPPLPAKEWPPEMGDALAAMIPPVQRHARPPLEDRPRARAMLGTFAHHPELARAFFTFNGHLLWATSLTPRQREILVLRVSAKRRAGYVWSMHLFEARDSGLTEEEIEGIASGPEAPCFEPLEQAMVRAVDELVDDGAIAGPTWEALASELDEQQLLDLLFTVAGYEATSWLSRSAGFEPDPDLPAMYERYQPPPDDQPR